MALWGSFQKTKSTLREHVSDQDNHQCQINRVIHNCLQVYKLSMDPYSASVHSTAGAFWGPKSHEELTRLGAGVPGCPYG
jgi:alanine racemase